MPGAGRKVGSFGAGFYGFDFLKVHVLEVLTTINEVGIGIITDDCTPLGEPRIDFVSQSVIVTVLELKNVIFVDFLHFYR